MRNETCHDHGNCSDNGCECDPQFAGYLCDKCAPRHHPYPACPELDLVAIFGEHLGKCFNPNYEYYSYPPLKLLVTYAIIE
jgi:hypothetical protein